MNAHIHFYCRKRLAAWPDLEKLGDAAAIEREQQRFRLGIDVWIVQTYLRLAPQLRTRGFTVSLGTDIPHGSILFVHRDELRGLCTGFHKAFVVAIRADRPPALAADVEILQNALPAATPRTFFIPSWPQPGLIPRDASRGNAIERMAYFGRRDSLPPWFSAPGFAAALKASGVEFEIRSQAWNDYHDVDLVLAHRIEAPTMLQQKPGSKLTNAWLAGVPALLPPEPEYCRMRTCADDFVEVSSPEDVLDAVRRLKTTPEAYASMRQQCVSRAADFSIEAVAAQWLALITGPLLARYRDWLESGGARRNVLGHALKLWQQKRSTQAFRKQVAAELAALGAPAPLRTSEPAPRSPEP